MWSNEDNGKRTAQRGRSQELSTTTDWGARSEPNQEAFALPLSMKEGPHNICPVGFQDCYAQQAVLVLVHGSANEEVLYLDPILRRSQNPGIEI